MQRVKAFMLRQGWRSADERSEVGVYFEALKGRLGRDGRYLGSMVKCASFFLSFLLFLFLRGCWEMFSNDGLFWLQCRKLPAAILRSLLEDMHAFFHTLPLHVRREQESARTKLVAWISGLVPEAESSQSGFVVQLAGVVGEWLTGYFQYVVGCCPRC